MAEIVLDQVTKVFPGGTVAVDAVSLDVADGEFMVLVGPSGCGKSTVLRMIAGLEDVTEGTVSIGGRTVNHLPPKDRDIAMVFQNYALYPHMTVDENLAFSLRIRRVPKADIRSQVAETAHVLDLEPLLGRKPAALSGGQRQRVAMGRAIIRRPQVFLMDEPLSNLDAKLRVAMRGQLSRLHRRYGTTTIYVTHDQIEAMTLGDRIAVLERGRLQQVGPPDELYAAPCNIFVAGFIGSPAMNLARGRLEAGTDGLTLVVGEYRWAVPEQELARRPSLREYAGREVVFGLRPGSLSLGAGAALDAPRLSAEAATVESLGSEKNVLFVPPFGEAAVVGPAGDAGADEAGGLWTARVGAFAPVHTADRVELVVDLSGIHFFNPETTEAIPVVTQAPVTAGSGHRA